MPWTSNFSTNLGRMPVGLRRPWILPSTTPVCSNTNTSCMTMTSPSMPWTSVMFTILRVPSLRRDCWTMMSTAEAICSRMARTGRSTPAISTIVSRRESMSRGLLAWPVDIEPSWPVFMAWSMSSASPDRHSPMMTRSGRMRRQFLTRSRWLISPLPSTLLGRVLDRDDPLVGGDVAGEAVEQRRLAGAGAAGDQDVGPGLHGGRQEVHDGRREGAVADQVFQLHRLAAE